ncbi:uncharacterized protein LOC135464076 [Liolophura sinensis]|uniref:uncharacterized protein LOC135464076 n=1 Tax=Liolophura sinensis TaxID=3198878 RepID=UPI003158FC5E
MAYNYAAQKLVSSLLKSLTLKGVKKMTFRFDPYHPKVFSIRELLFITNSPRILETNLNCDVKVDVKSDRSEPVFDVEFIDDSKAVFKTENLLIEDIMTRFHRLCEEKCPEQDDSLLDMGKKPMKRKR